jgi:hypothetical protein
LLRAALTVSFPRHHPKTNLSESMKFARDDAAAARRDVRTRRRTSAVAAVGTLEVQPGGDPSRRDNLPLLKQRRIHLMRAPLREIKRGAQENFLTGDLTY